MDRWSGESKPSYYPRQRPTSGSSGPVSDAEALTRAALTADGRALIEQADGSFRLAEGRTDWQRVDRVTEEELAAAIASDPDDPANDPDSGSGRSASIRGR